MRLNGDSAARSFSIRKAEAADAHAIVKVVRDSIAQLCVADHHNDPELLSAWLENKTAENLAKWFGDPNNYCVVAQNERLVGVAVLNRSGEVQLMYVAPGAQRQGIGRMLHDSLEQKAKQWELKHLGLGSTRDARAFYESVGYVSTGELQQWRGILCYKYEKLLK
jgi:GNAT superfamily N-acetyltransferase